MRILLLAILLLGCSTRDKIKKAPKLLISGDIFFNQYQAYREKITKSDIKFLYWEIDTLGGSTNEYYSFLSFVDEFKRRGGYISCLVTGSAMSAGFSLLQLCDYRKAKVNSRFMQHHSWRIKGTKRVNVLTYNEMARLALSAERTNIGLLRFMDEFVTPERIFDNKTALEIGAIDEIVY